MRHLLLTPLLLARRGIPDLLRKILSCFIYSFIHTPIIQYIHTYIHYYPITHQWPGYFLCYDYHHISTTVLLHAFLLTILPCRAIAAYDCQLLFTNLLHPPYHTRHTFLHNYILSAKVDSSMQTIL